MCGYGDSSLPLFVPERRDRVEPRRLQRGPHTEEQADAGGLAQVDFGSIAGDIDVDAVLGSELGCNIFQQLYEIDRLNAVQLRG